MPLTFFGQERVVVEEAWPGDIIGLVDTNGSLRIGDTLSSVKDLEYTGVPSFSPEHFCSLTILDPMKRKQLQKGVEQLSEEGVVQVYRQIGMGDKDFVLGAVGALQFEVLQHRLKVEYAVDVRIDKLGFQLCRWIIGDEKEIQAVDRREDSRILEDRDQNKVVLFRSDWAANWAKDNHKNLTFLQTAPPKRR